MSSESSTAPDEAIPTVSVRGSLMAWLRSLSLLEMICCLSILVGIGGFALVVFLPALMDFPKPAALATSGDFPLKGEHVEVLAAKAHWLKPTEELASSEMAALPVLQLKLSGKGLARVLFRDAEGRAIGDPVTIPVAGQKQLPAVGTTGLATPGDYAAYRVGEIDAWKVELLEAPSDAQDPAEFTRLFQMRIPAILR